MSKILKVISFSSLVFLLFMTACGGQQIGSDAAGATALADQLTDLPSTAGTPGVPGTLPLETVTAASPAAGATGAASLVPPAGGTPASAATLAPAIPVTGAGPAEILCQFCVEQIPHAVLVLPQNATFSLVSAGGSQIAPSAQLACNPIEVLNGKQVVMCYGQSATPITLQVCTDASNCVQVPIKLANCPGAQGSGPNAASTQLAPGMTQTVVAPPGGLTPTPGSILPSPTISP